MILKPHNIRNRFIASLDESERGHVERFYERTGEIHPDYESDYIEFGLAELKKELRGETNKKEADMVPASKHLQRGM